eukprot:gnl/Hemi2/23564_TR7910_c0_g1_i1.p1 gnl/Hemi2/23564_TR7910_c0_g1~~gnl/Hemi2/23564_TR7910_c0_g1_i1.p1  ORF type:complete len:429 (-),score=118.17 gnl/Hemi2/23564_TR7910_c0_g1_i1:107-1393(-)
MSSYITTSMASFSNKTTNHHNDENATSTQLKKPQAAAAGLATAARRRELGDITNITNLISKPSTQTAAGKGVPPANSNTQRPRVRLVSSSAPENENKLGAGQVRPTNRLLLRPGASAGNSSDDSLDSCSAIDATSYKSDSTAASLASAVSSSTSAPTPAFSADPLSDSVDDPLDQLLVAEYVEDIYKYLRRAEAIHQVSPGYMARQPDINEKMRAILVDWMVDVHLKFRLLPETLFLAIYILDRVLEKQSVSRSKLQLVGTAALLVASKYEEIHVPEMNDFIFISANFYTRDDMVKMESFILNTLEFKLTVPTTLTFLRRFCRIAKADARTEDMAIYLIELGQLELPMLKYSCSLSAAAALHCAMRVCAAGTWTSSIRHHTLYSEAQLEPCVKALMAIGKASSNANLGATRRKYGVAKYHGVAKIPIS